MATLAQIAAKSDSTLSALERDKVREILGHKATPGTTEYVSLEATIDDFSVTDNQRARAYIDDWDAIPAQPSEMRGGAKGLYYKTERHQHEIRNRMRLLVGEDEVDWADDEDAVQFVTLTLGGLYAEESA